MQLQLYESTQTTRLAQIRQELARWIMRNESWRDHRLAIVRADSENGESEPVIFRGVFDRPTSQPNSGLDPAA